MCAKQLLFIKIIRFLVSKIKKKILYTIFYWNVIDIIIYLNTIYTEISKQNYLNFF